MQAHHRHGRFYVDEKISKGVFEWVAIFSRVSPNIDQDSVLGPNCCVYRFVEGRQSFSVCSFFAMFSFFHPVLDGFKMRSDRASITSPIQRIDGAPPKSSFLLVNGNS